MTTLILQPTDTSQWYTLIIEAQSKSQIILPEDTESYLVFLLMRSSTNTIWLDAIIGMDYMLALQEKGEKQKNLLMNVGDTSLLLSGFFPEFVHKYQLDPKYYAEIGQLAYSRLGAFPDESKQKIFNALSEHFLDLSKVLQTAKKNLVQDINSLRF